MNRKERESNSLTLNSNMFLYMRNGIKISNYWVCSAIMLFHVELTATEPMDHESLVTSQAMYAFDDDSCND